MPIIRRFLADQTGTTAIEYCMIGAMISIVILASATLIGARLNTLFFEPIAAGFP